MNNKRLRGSYTVENAVIIPLFTIITLLLIFLGFYVENSVVIKAHAWKSAIQLERSENDVQAQRDTEQILQNELRSGTLFINNISTHAITMVNKGTKVSVNASTPVSGGGFTMGNKINFSEEAKSNNPADSLRKWHALQKIK